MSLLRFSNLSRISFHFIVKEAESLILGNWFSNLSISPSRIVISERYWVVSFSMSSILHLVRVFSQDFLKSGEGSLMVGNIWIRSPKGQTFSVMYDSKYWMCQYRWDFFLRRLNILSRNVLVSSSDCWFARQPACIVDMKSPHAVPRTSKAQNL